MIPAVAGRGIFVAGGRPPPGKLVALLAREAWSLCRLGPRVAVFYLRSLWTAARARDEWTLASAARPRELAPLLEAARGLGTVVEMGTGTAWSAAALALADSRRVIFTYDPIVRHERDLYLGLLRPDARSRIHLLGDPDADGRARSVYEYETVAVKPHRVAAASAPQDDSGSDALLVALAVIGSVVVAGGGLVVWAHS